MEQKIEQAIRTSNYSALASIFSGSSSVDSWQSLSQSEQRSLSAFFLKTAVSSSEFLPSAFSSDDIITVIKRALGNLPSSVENAYDNRIREMMFDYLVEQEEYREAASILAGKRMEDMDENSVYYTTPNQKSDVYVRIAECCLEAGDIAEADAAVTRAGSTLETISDPDNNLALILRYKSTCARVLDSNRKFLQAASRYYDLSKVGSITDMIESDDLLTMLGRAAKCAILAPSGPQRQRIMNLVFNDERLSKLDLLPSFQTDYTILRKMCTNQIIRKDEDLSTFENSLESHQKTVMSDGLTFIQRAITEHNMCAISALYTNIYFSELGQLLDVTAENAEIIAAKMISNGLLSGSIDQVQNLLRFDVDDSSSIRNRAISDFCANLNLITDSIRQELQ